MPTSFFVDRDGTVVAAQLGLTSKEDIESNIEKRIGSRQVRSAELNCGESCDLSLPRCVIVRRLALALARRAGSVMRLSASFHL